MCVTDDSFTTMCVWKTAAQQAETTSLVELAEIGWALIHDYGIHDQRRSGV